VIDNTTTPASRSTTANEYESNVKDQRTAARNALRIIFLNVYSHNSICLNSAKYDCGWRFTITICWRDGEPIPCPAAVGHVIEGRAGHQVEIEFSVLTAENAVKFRVRVDDARLLDNFPSVSLSHDHAMELQRLLREHLGLAYPRVENQPSG